jgi:hypothetical protein
MCIRVAAQAGCGADVVHRPQWLALFPRSSVVLRNASRSFCLLLESACVAYVAGPVSGGRHAHAAASEEARGSRHGGLMGGDNVSINLVPRALGRASSCRRPSAVPAARIGESASASPLPTANHSDRAAAAISAFCAISRDIRPRASSASPDPAGPPPAGIMPAGGQTAGAERSSPAQLQGPQRAVVADGTSASAAPSSPTVRLRRNGSSGNPSAPPPPTPACAQQSSSAQDGFALATGGRASTGCLTSPLHPAAAAEQARCKPPPASPRPPGRLALWKALRHALAGASPARLLLAFLLGAYVARLGCTNLFGSGPGSRGHSSRGWESRAMMAHQQWVSQLPLAWGEWRPADGGSVASYANRP